ncbi:MULTISPECIES: hypothetical protein [Kitasatospora]|uniref:Peptidase S54 rhomboid domain-containing protein n=1 Tax=Kitasatospora setae (strain ATCC 33774 / DSM 43861 / JCM 3304 / KCC A-0304 / NBRC 14216 / KM-6054) TaxID=452652 RepID=E4N3T6_KITSK|nr:MULTISPECIES: hypothetical protein [Kitasatospora]BAJ31567.1 hypothetical protein KSE_57960 [Kitasatospora setae KM-6054]
MDIPGIRRAAENEWGPLYRRAQARLRARGAAALTLTAVAGGLVLLFATVDESPGGAALVSRMGVVRAAEPWDVALLRFPLSIFVPAIHLPCWTALFLVVLAFGTAELALGPWRSLAVGYTCSLAGTCYARIGVSRPPGHLLHLPAEFAQVRDTGPSAAVVGLGLLVAWRFGARWTALGVALLTTALTVADPELAGYEHLAALATAAALLLADGLARRLTTRGPQGSEAALRPR